MKHKCGYITKTYKKGVLLEYMCQKHKNNKRHIWIIMQHKDDKKTRKLARKELLK